MTDKNVRKPQICITRETKHVYQLNEYLDDTMEPSSKFSDKIYVFDTTGFVTDIRFLNHFTGAGHPESPERLQAILDRVENGELGGKLFRLAPHINPDDYITLVHPQHHINGLLEELGDDALCRLAVSAVLTAVDAVSRGRIRNAFCAVRPPGHHALNTGEEGFCFYNNVAIAARYAQKIHGFEKILIIDWDYHHGNGTEMAFYDDPSVLFFSTHSLYAYPGTGDPERKGRGAGKGYTINVALPSGTDDERVIRAFREQLLPAATAFCPDFVLISAGFDSRKHDRLGDFCISDAGFAELTRMVKLLAETSAAGRLVSVLEGGYTPLGLATAVEAHIRVLAEITP